MTKTTNIPDEITLSIHGLGHSGEGVGYYDGFTVFVDGALPEEIVIAKIIKKHKTYGFAKLVSIIQPSPNRVSPPCPLFGTCGGCQLMHLSYPKQLIVKKQKVIDAIVRIGKISPSTVLDCVPSPLPLAYRNKIQLPVKDPAILGLYAKNSHDLIEVKQCLIHCSLGEEVFQKIQELLKQSKIQALNPKTQKGTLRHLLIKSAIHTKQTLVVLITNQEATPELQLLAKEIFTTIPSVQGVIHNIHQDQENVILGKTYQTLEGVQNIEEIICGLSFSISAASFFQVNPLQAEQLYQKALEFADVQQSETVLDAFCGVGTLSLIFAKQAKTVIGIECVPEAIDDAKKNSKKNKIENTSFVCAHTENILDTIPQTDIVLLNPPRKGCDPRLLKKIVSKKIVYISCDPATLARDLNILQQAGYKVEQIQPFDMFPQTYHVECVAKLSRL